MFVVLVGGLNEGTVSGGGGGNVDDKCCACGASFTLAITSVSRAGEIMVLTGVVDDRRKMRFAFRLAEDKPVEDWCL